MVLHGPEFSNMGLNIQMTLNQTQRVFYVMLEEMFALLVKIHSHLCNSQESKLLKLSDTAYSAI